MPIPSPETQLVIAEAKVRLLTEACEQLAVELARRTATTEDLDRIFGALKQNRVHIIRPDTRNLEHGSVDMELYKERVQEDLIATFDDIVRKARNGLRRSGAPGLSNRLNAQKSVARLQAPGEPQSKKPKP